MCYSTNAASFSTFFLYYIFLLHIAIKETSMLLMQADSSAIAVT